MPVRPELDKTVPARSEKPDVTATAAPAPRPGADPSGVSAGQQLGHFRIEKQLGAGGMGEVYLATDLALDRPVAIKVLPTHLAGDAGRRERMIREARAQARVIHPNVGHIYFIGEQDRLLYFAMEYVPGQTLSERLAKGPLPVDEALEVIHAAALGLREAQRSGFTHRDVKPSNLMLDGHGVLKVLDFGLAAGEAGVPANGPVAQTSLVGTPLYMAPEQGRGEPVDFRADIYALGATLYHLVSGEPPYKADSLDELLTLHATAARPAVRRKGQPRTSIAAIDALVARMMAPNVPDRFGSYDELIRAIELASVSHSRPAGFMVRAIATALDAFLVALVLGVFLNGVTFATGYQVRTVVPFFAIAGLYNIIAVHRWGRTPGKALFELEVVDIASGLRPSWKQAFTRVFAMIGLPAITAWTLVALDDLVPNDMPDLVMFAWFGLCVIALVHASTRVHAKRAPWDRISKTMVRYRSLRSRETV